MKIFAVILSVLVLVLTVSSGLWERLEKMEENPTSHICENPPCDDDCPNCCSPFHICCTCVGFVVSPQYFYKSGDVLFCSNEFLIPESPFYLFCFGDEIWQPPQFA